MGWSTFQISIAVLMVVTGSINTIAAKWANLLYAENSVGAHVPFNHPYLQAVAMFVGEWLCMWVFYCNLLCHARKIKDSLSANEAVPDAANKVDSEDNSVKPATEDNSDMPDAEVEDAKTQLKNYVNKRQRKMTLEDAELPNIVVEKKQFTIKHCYILIPASLCDMCGTSLMYTALTLTTASMFQMLRGSVIIFTGITSMIFLKRRLEWFRWAGMLTILAGLIITGLPDLLYPKETTCYKNVTSDTSSLRDVDSDSAPNYEFDVYALEPLCKEDGESGGAGDGVIGDILIICAQLVVSLQMVYEEKVLSGYIIQPLEAVGWEGFWGFCGMSICLVGFAFLPVGDSKWSYSPTPPWILEDAIDGFIQFGTNPLILLAIAGMLLSIAFFNFCGLTVTQQLSATTRMVLDSVRTMIIWIFELILGWNTFQYLQLIGFAVLLSGMTLYNDLLFMPAIRDYRAKKKST